MSSRKCERCGDQSTSTAYQPAWGLFMCEDCRTPKDPATFKKSLAMHKLTEAASDLLQVALLMREAGYVNESVGMASLSTQVSYKLQMVREHLLGT